MRRGLAEDAEVVRHRGGGDDGERTSQEFTPSLMLERASAQRICQVVNRRMI
ncbi:hypothetical protein ACSS6W_002283 [Trichoderma asperelloides]